MTMNAEGAFSDELSGNIKELSVLLIAALLSFFLLTYVGAFLGELLVFEKSSIVRD